MAGVRYKQGIAFITALAMMFILLTLGAAYLMIARSEIQVNTNQMNALRAFYVAESGIEHAVAELKEGTDIDGDGLGTVSGSLDGYNYSVTYGPVTSTITSVGTVEQASRSIEVKISMSGFTGALQVGANIDASSTSGTVTGNVDAGHILDLDSLVIEGTVTDHDGDLAVPSPTFSSYEAIADYVYDGNQVFDVDPPPGIHYINGNLTIENNITINGTVVVTKGLNMNSAENCTITPSGKNAAIIVSQNITANSIGGSTFNGLVYAGHSILFNSWSEVTVDGGIVAGHTLNLIGGENVSVTFDADLDPPYFSGSEGETVRITSWQGYVD